MPVHVGAQVRTDTCEDRANPFTAQFIEQIAYGLRGRKINIRDGTRVDNKPPNWRRCMFDESTHFVSEAVVVVSACGLVCMHP